MKIEKIKYRILEGLEDQGNKVKKGISSDDFDRYLLEATGVSDMSGGEKSAGVAPLSSLSEAASALCVQSQSVSSDMVFADRAESVMEKLSSALEQGNSKAIGDLINELGEVLQNAGSENLSVKGKKLIEELKIVAYTEGIKWARGDYI